MKRNRLFGPAVMMMTWCSLALAAPTARAQEVTATFTNTFGDGIWQRDAHIGVIGNPNDLTTPGNWDTLAYPDNHHHITDPNTNTPLPNADPLYDVEISIATPCNLAAAVGVSIQTLTVANISELDIAGGSLIAITNGSVVNNGLIRINTTDPLNSESDLRFDSDTQVTGSGSILLNGIGFSRANFNLSVATVTIGANQLIHGYGSIVGFSGATMINDGTINGDDPTSTMQLILSHTNQNNNLIEATNGAILTMYGGGIDQTGGGTFLADGSGSSVQFFAANNGTDFPVVIGGILTTANGGIVEPGQPGSNAVFLQGCTNNGDLRIPGGEGIVVTGSGLTNNGTILINSTDPINSESDLRWDASGTLGGTGSVTLNGVGFNRANLNLNVATVTIGANQLIHGYGSIVGFGGATMINDGTINGDDPTSTMQLILSHTNQNNNLIEATKGATLTMYGGGIDQTGGGTLLADGSGSFVQFFAANNGVDFPVVIGGILTTANGGIVEPGQPGSNAVFLQGCTNNGDLRIPGGEEIVVTGSGLTNNGTILINSTDPTNSVSDLRWDASGTLGGTGSVLLNGVGFNRANLDLSVATVTIGANQLIHGYGSVVGFNGATMINNGTINGDDASGNNMQLDLANTTNQNNGTIEATNGGVTGFNSGTIDQTGGGTFLATGNSSKAQLGTFNGGSYGHIIGGTLNGTSGGVVSSLASILDGDITNSGAFEIPADGIVLSYASTLTNNGSITMDDNTGLFRFDQNNTAIGGNGFIALMNGAQMTINGGQSVSNGSNHTIKGNGTIGIVGGGTFTNNGFIAPGLSPGQLNLNGNLQLNFPSKLSFEIGGTTPATQYDVLNKIDGGTLILNGKLILNLSNGFTPQQSDTFTILTTQTPLGGNFTNVKSGGRMNTDDGGGSFQVDYHVINNPPLSQVVTLSNFGPLLPPSQSLNISTRADVESGEGVAIGGFIITGTDSKKVIIRGIGPSLTSFGLQNVLADPTLELHDSNPNDPPIATNDNWKINDQTQQSQETEVSATGLPPSNDLESAIIVTLPPGAYTAILNGKNNGTGIGLVEIYDLDPAANSKLGNISTRGFVGTGDNVLIGGTIVDPTNGNSSRIFLRVRGPSLQSSGVNNPLADPTLELHDGNGVLIALNDNWKDVQQTDIESTGLAPSDDAEPAILLDLAPGPYTSVVRGTNDTTGIALVEVYNLPH